MNTSPAVIDYTTLGWVKPEIDVAMLQIRTAVEEFLAAPDDVDIIRGVIDPLRQVRGTLQMLEMHAPAMVAQDMEHTAEAVVQGRALANDKAGAALLRGALQLPDYLERLQDGHRDVPMALLPLVNELRESRGDGAMSEDDWAQATRSAAGVSVDEMEHARGSLSGRNRALLDTVSGAVKEDLMQVKDVLDLHLRNPQADVVRLRVQADTLTRVADTLAMLGLDEDRASIQQQRDAVALMAQQGGMVDELRLMDIAGALLRVEASMDEHVAGLNWAEGGSELLALGEARKLASALAREAIANFADARQGLVAFVESNWDHSHLADVPRLLQEVTGALRMLDLSVPADYLVAVRGYVEHELIDQAKVPTGRQLDSLADALASIEYFLEALRDQRGNRDGILDIARQSLESLQYWPLPEHVDDEPRVASPAADADDLPATPVDAEPATDAPAAVPSDEAHAHADVLHATPAGSAVTAETDASAAPAAEPAAPESVRGLEGLDAIPVDAFGQTTATATADASTPLAGGFDLSSDDIDDEIRGIFLEELQEEMQNLDAQLPEWRDAPDDADRLHAIRRIFHTLKGSGRLVGARTLGEFSWHIEHMLNSVRDGHRAVSPAVVQLVGHAAGVLPQLHDALSGVRGVSADLDAITAAADRIAAGEDVFLTDAQVAGAAATAVVETTQPPSVPVDVPALAETDIVADSVAQADTVEVVPETAAQAGAEPVAVETAADTPVEPVSMATDEESAVSEEWVDTPEVDPVLLEILVAEVQGHLQTVDDWSQRAAGTALADEPLLRALHTMNGAFAMADVPAITEAIHPAEGYVRRLLGNHVAMDAAGVAAIAQLADAILGTLNGLQSTPTRVPVVQALGAQLSQLRNGLPEAVWPPRETLEDRQLAEAERLEAERVEAERLEAERLEAERVEAERLEAERLEAERLEAERLEAERLEAERLEAERLEAERLEAERLEAERVEAERLEAERVETERLEAERLEAERLEAERVEAERLEAERVEAERLEAERLEAERVEAERVEAERVEAERVEAERVEAERVAAEDEAEYARLEAEYAEQDRIAREKAEADAQALAALEANLLDMARSDSESEAAAQQLAGQREQEHRHAQRRAEERIRAIRERVDEAAPTSTAAIRLVSEELRNAAEQADLRAKEFEDFLRLEEQRLRGTGSDADADEDKRLDPRLQVQIDAMHAEAARLQHEAEVAALREKEFHDFAVMEEQRLKAQAEAAAAAAATEGVPAEIVEPVAAEASDDTTLSPLVAAALLRPLAEIDDPAEPLDSTDLDSELVEIFVEEAGDLLDHADGVLNQFAAEPRQLDHVTALQRDLHTIKGGARMAGLMEVGETAHAMESLLEALAERTVAVNVTTIPLLEVGFDRLHAMVTRIGEQRAVATPERLIAEFNAHARGESSLLRPGADAVRVPGHDPTAHEPADADHPVASIEDRDATAAVVEDASVQQPAEPVAAESAVDDDALAVEALLDSLKDVTADDAETWTDAGAVASLAGDDRPVHADHGETVPTDVVEAVDMALSAFAPLPELPPLSPPVSDRIDLDDDSIAQAPQEQVRIRADLLDRLVNYAGEVAIYRARLEQQLAGFRAAMVEMEQTNTRLRDQLRRLDAETEAQIVARYQREQDVADPAFDPLELDRFSSLQQLSRALGETSSDMISLQATLSEQTRQYETLLLQQSRVSSELQEGLMRTRMLPFDSLVPRLRRVVRQAASETGKHAQLKLEGAQGELDRNVLERMTAPLEHMLRNAVAHGLEMPDARRAANKAEEGTVRIAVRREGSEVVLEVGDDGSGINLPAIQQRALQRGLLPADAQPSDSELRELIFQPGFSTAESVSRLAGRGVGMDVVASEIRQLGGSIDIDSREGRGTTFALRLPQTMAVTQAVFVRIGETTFAVPIASVRGVGRVNRDVLDQDDPVYSYGGEDYIIRDLGQLVGHPPARAEGQLQMPLLLIRAGDLRAAVSVDQVLGNREIVVKPLGPQVASVPGIFGATIMGDGSVVVILDVAPLVRRQTAHQRVVATPVAVESRVPLVMVVDDSITMRKVSGRVLERHNYEVVTAKDGVDALERLEERLPDLMLLDIEMPRMDGYELATRMRADVRMRNIPIIMITSRTGEKHRQRAFEIGVERYLGKPYQEAELMRNVNELLLATGVLQEARDV
ncbi:MAG: hybrid sensor histidine kinase/response regulator [Pseudoxanthomonas suwonensis]|nr:MAG: hybrid sensor histidine kinase/response regulator [Pseudoxanthomonas suwonensis]